MNRGKELRCKIHHDGYKEYQYLDKKKGMSDSEIEAIFGVLQQVPVGDTGISMGVEGLKGKASVEDKESQGEDMVAHPPHYNKFSVEVKDTIKEWVEGYKDAYVAYCIGNVLKYLSRAPFKGSMLQDLKKASFYLTEAIKEIEFSKGAK